MGPGEDARGRVGPGAATEPSPATGYDDRVNTLGGRAARPDRSRDRDRHRRAHDPAVPEPGSGSPSSRAAPRRRPGPASRPRSSGPPPTRSWPTSCSVAISRSRSTASPSSTSASGLTWPMSGSVFRGLVGPRHRLGRRARRCQPAARPGRDVAGRSRRRDRADRSAWSSLGVVGLFAFDQLFELFHQIFFPAGLVSVRPDSRTGSSSCSRSRSGTRPRWSSGP